MRSIFHPFMPNGPSGDPLVWVDVLDHGHALLLDLGNPAGLANRHLLRVARAVVTHAHMDHFIGFDALLRVSLTREDELHLTGPAGFIEHVAGRLAGYVWNLIDRYPVRLVVEAIDGERVRTARFEGRHGLAARPAGERPFDGLIHRTEAYELRGAVLDHGIPVLGVVLREGEHLAIDKDRLTRWGLVPGPWLGQLKRAVRSERPGDESFEALASDGNSRRYPLRQLRDELVRRMPGQDIGYLTDLSGTSTNLAAARDLVQSVHLLVCETMFLDEDAGLARERRHLTARQAGELARAAGARSLAPFHISPRYQGREEQLFEEAAHAFGGPVRCLPPAPNREAPTP